MAIFYVNQTHEGLQDVQSLYLKACELKNGVENNLKPKLHLTDDCELSKILEDQRRGLESQICVNLREYAKFSTLLGQQYANPDDIDININIKQKVGNQLRLLPPRQPISDYELLYAYYHNAGATSNRTVGGRLATSIVIRFIEDSEKNSLALPHKMTEIWVSLNNIAASRGKFLRSKGATMDMDTSREIFSAINVGDAEYRKNPLSKKLKLMLNQFSGGFIPEDLRELFLAHYLVSFEEPIYGAIADLQRVLSHALELHPAIEGFVSDISKQLAYVLEDIESEREEIHRFANPPSPSCRFFRDIRNSISTEFMSKLDRIEREKHLPHLACYESALVKQNMKENVEKSVVIGSAAFRTFSLINRFVHNQFTSHYKNTIGVDFQMKLFEIGRAKLGLQLWERNGAELFSSRMIKELYRNTDMVYLICDINNRQTIEALPDCVAGIVKYSFPGNAPTLIILASNSKNNALVSETPPTFIHEMDALGTQLNASNWYMIDTDENSDNNEVFTVGL